jgi:multisubunit Na+/H+ antiporter MnhB subunit
MTFIFDVCLVALVLAIAIWAIAARDAVTAVVTFVVYGLLVGIVWVRLSAIDVALTEIAIGAGLTGVLLLSAAARLRNCETSALERPRFILRIAAGVLSAVVALALAAAILLLPDLAPTLAPTAAANAVATGLGNPVTSVLMAFRAMDTMLEKVVLLLALVGVWSLAPDRFWGGLPGPPQNVPSSSVLIFVAQVLPPIGIVVGIYMLWEGADHPGGAFPGGTILAAMWSLVMIAGLLNMPPASSKPLRLTLLVGPLAFLIVGVGGLWAGDAFLAYPVPYAKPLILFIEFAMTLSIAATLGQLLAGPPERAARR